MKSPRRWREVIIRESLDESNAFEVFQLACGPHKSDELKIAAFRKLQEVLGKDLDDNLINNPDQLEEIVRAKRLCDDFNEQNGGKEVETNLG